MSILKKTIDILKEDGTEVYMPSQHKGECINEYIVVKMDGVIDVLDISSERPIYTIMCYVPYNQYSKLESFVQNIASEIDKKNGDNLPVSAFLQYGFPQSPSPSVEVRSR